MKRASGAILVLLFFFAWKAGAQQSSVRTQKCIAMVLQIDGDRGEPVSVRMKNFTVFTGRIKEKYEKNSSTTINIQITGDNGELIFNGYVVNPLMEKLEAFNEDSTMERLNATQNTGYVNVRFPVNGAVKSADVRCYKINRDTAGTLLSEFKLDLR